MFVAEMSKVSREPLKNSPTAFCMDRVVSSAGGAG
jgi:hypothetical protein